MQPDTALQKREIMVVGHKNPDTDSICSAIAYAALKNKLDPQNTYVAARAGEVSSETAYVLQRAQTEPPVLFHDAATQVEDLDIRPAQSKPLATTLQKAWQHIHQHHLSTLPLTENGHLAGLVTVADIARLDLMELDRQLLGKAKTTVQNVLDTLQGTLLWGDAGTLMPGGKILIGAAEPERMGKFVEAGDIVLLSGNEQSQMKALEKGAACLVVTLEGPVPPAVLALAKQKNCTLLSTVHDTFTAARLIYQSIPVSYIATTENIESFSTQDKLEDVRDAMVKSSHAVFPVLDESRQYVGTISKGGLLGARRKQVILVDHNERSQSVDNLEEAEILEIIDHHRIGSIETLSPVYFRNQPLGCTSTIVHQMYGENHLKIDRQTALLLCSAILSDTLMFRSPTCTPKDIAAAEALAAIAGIEIEPYAEAMFRAGSDLAGKTDQELFYQDFKVFSAGDVRFGITQVSSMSKEELGEMKARLSPLLGKAKEEQRLDMAFALLTDIRGEESEVLWDGAESRKMAQKAFPKTAIQQGRLVLPEVLSRKKQFVPPLIEAIQAD